MMKKLLKFKAFTLLELIIYIALAAILLISIISISQNLALSNTKAKAQEETTFYARLVTGKLSEKIRNADDVTIASSTFNTHPGKLTLDYPGANTDVIFDTYTKVLPNNLTIRKLRIKEGAATAQDLTSDQVNVTNFVIRNLTKLSEAKNLNIELTIASATTSTDPHFTASISVETAVSLRK